MPHHARVQHGALRRCAHWLRTRCGRSELARARRLHAHLSHTSRLPRCSQASRQQQRHEAHGCPSSARSRSSSSHLPTAPPYPCPRRPAASHDMGEAPMTNRGFLPRTAAPHIAMVRCGGECVRVLCVLQCIAMLCTVRMSAGLWHRVRPSRERHRKEPPAVDRLRGEPALERRRVHLRLKPHLVRTRSDL